MKSATMTRQHESPIADWRADSEITKWTQKLSEVSTKLSQAESRQNSLAREIEQSEESLIRVKSSLILGEGSDEGVATHESALESLHKEQTRLTSEIAALKFAQSRIQQEISTAEAAAKDHALQAFRPILEDKGQALVSTLEAARQLNEEFEALEQQLDKQGLRQQNGWIPKILCVKNINFPEGISAYKQNLEAQLRKL